MSNPTAPRGAASVQQLVTGVASDPSSPGPALLLARPLLKVGQICAKNGKFSYTGMKTLTTIRCYIPGLTSLTLDLVLLGAKKSRSKGADDKRRHKNSRIPIF